MLLAPVLGLLVVLIRFNSPGPGIFRQWRVGRNEKPFMCYKLRTMREGTDEVPTHEAPKSELTSLGKILRKTKLDELPQLVNVIKGEMSFVGPRPCLIHQTELIEARRAYGLEKIRPGITGVSQVAGVDMREPQRLADLDATYLKDMSLSTDIGLVMRTIFPFRS